MTRALGRVARAALVMIAAGAGCLPSLIAESPPPPGRTARLDALPGFWGVSGYTIELSLGVALAITCSAGGPCAELTATSDDRTIAEVRAASLSTLRPAGWAMNPQPPAAVVVVGKAVGRTVVRLRSKDGGRDVPVTVVAPPLPRIAAVAR